MQKLISKPMRSAKWGAPLEVDDFSSMQTVEEMEVAVSVSGDLLRATLDAVRMPSKDPLIATVPATWCQTVPLLGDGNGTRKARVTLDITGHCFGLRVRAHSGVILGSTYDFFMIEYSRLMVLQYLLARPVANKLLRNSCERKKKVIHILIQII